MDERGQSHFQQCYAVLLLPPIVMTEQVVLIREGKLHCMLQR